MLEKLQTPVSEKAQASTFWPHRHPHYVCSVLLPASMLVSWPLWTRSPASLLSWVRPRLCPSHPPPRAAASWPVLLSPAWLLTKCSHDTVHTARTTTLRPSAHSALHEIPVCRHTRTELLARKGSKRTGNQARVCSCRMPSCSEQTAHPRPGCHIAKPPHMVLGLPDNKGTLCFFWKFSWR